MAANLVRDIEKDNAVVTDDDVVNDPKNETKRSAPDNQVPLLINTFVNPIGNNLRKCIRNVSNILLFQISTKCFQT